MRRMKTILGVAALLFVASAAQAADSVVMRINFTPWAMHAQYYDWFLFSEVLSIGLLLGYMRYRSNSTWLTIIMHGINNFAATLQSIWLAGQT